MCEIIVALWYHIVTWNKINIGAGNGLLTDSTITWTNFGSIMSGVLLHSPKTNLTGSDQDSDNSTPFSLTLRHFRWHWGVQNTNYDIEINAICSVSVRF